MAIDSIKFSATRIDAPGKLAMRSVRASLTLPSAAAPKLDAQVLSLKWPGLSGAWEQWQLRCGGVLLEEPHWHCDRASLKVGRSPLGALQASFDASLDSSSNRTEVELSGMPVAGGSLQLHAIADGLRWRVDNATLKTSLQPLAQWLQRWWQPPGGLQYAGQVTLQASASGNGITLDQGTLQAQLRELNLQNAAGTWVSEKLALDASVQLRGSLQHPAGSLQLISRAGQVLAGPALLDFNAHPLQLDADINYAGGELALPAVRIASAGLAEAHGEARVALTPTLSLRNLRADVTRLEFPAAYTSFLQIPLAATNFGNLDTHGSLRVQLQLTDDHLVSLDVDSGDASLEFSDLSKGLALQGLSGKLHWLAGTAAQVAPSRVQWQALRAFGLSGGAATLQLRAQGDALQLLEPAQVPLFDGVLAIQRFDAQRLGDPDVTLAFDGRIEAVGMPQLSRAVGWPEMAGTLSGRLPGLEYRGGTLRVAGDITAQVFDGTIVASGLQLRDVFSRFPRFSGNFTARQLDLGLITRTFPIGSITGHLDADVRGLELFGWQAVAFDAQLYTSPGDRSRHRISQRAVGNLANLGGGGGGVTAALQSGFLRFFDEFGYDRVGLRCQLRNDVCLISGIERPDGGFYIVKGGGLPRLDVIGTSGRIAWSQLVSQIGLALSNGQLEVR